MRKRSSNAGFPSENIIIADNGTVIDIEDGVRDERA